jgi:hypothetical protein
VRHVAQIGEKRKAYMISVEKPEENKPQGRSKTRG